eukprot:9201304-Alexandrium_andersonii.AAC.1
MCIRDRKTKRQAWARQAVPPTMDLGLGRLPKLPRLLAKELLQQLAVRGAPALPGPRMLPPCTSGSTRQGQPAAA